MFGLLFTGMKIRKYEEDNVRATQTDINTTTVSQEIKIPVSYGKKDKFIARYIRRNVSLKGVEKTVPRITFEITNVYYDGERKLNRNHQFISPTEINTEIKTVLTPVPYNFDIELSILANRNDDATKIIEQILPKFTPDIKIATKLIDDLNLTLDHSVILNHVYVDDTFEGKLVDTERLIIWGINFTVRGYLFREVEIEKTATTIITNIGVGAIAQGTSTILPSPVDANYSEDYGFTIS